MLPEYYLFPSHMYQFCEDLNRLVNIEKFDFVTNLKQFMMILKWCWAIMKQFCKDYANSRIRFKNVKLFLGTLRNLVKLLQTFYRFAKI